MTSKANLTCISQLDEGIEPSLAPPLSNIETFTKTSSPPSTHFPNSLAQTPAASFVSSTKPPPLSIRSFYDRLRVSIGSVASAAAFYSQYLESRPYRTYSVRTFCESLFNSPRAADATIVSVKRYGDRFGMLHRFLILHIVRDDGKDFYLRLDRRPDRGDTSLWKFGSRDLGKSNVADTASSKFCIACTGTDQYRLTGCHIRSTRTPARFH